MTRILEHPRVDAVMDKYVPISDRVIDKLEDLLDAMKHAHLNGLGYEIIYDPHHRPEVISPLAGYHHPAWFESAVHRVVAPGPFWIMRLYYLTSSASDQQPPTEE